MAAMLHHHGVLVNDAQRAGDFYCLALDAAWLARPILFDGPGAEQAMGEAGVRLKLGIVGLDGGGAVESSSFSTEQRRPGRLIRSAGACPTSRCRCPTPTWRSRG